MTLLTTAEAAEHIGVAPRTIRSWCRQGKITGARRIGRDWVMESKAIVGLTVGVGGKPTHKKGGVK